MVNLKLLVIKQLISIKINNIRFIKIHQAIDQIIGKQKKINKI